MKSAVLHCVWLVCALVLSASQLVAQAAKSDVNARLSSGIVKLGSDVRLIVEVEGAEQASIAKLFDVPGLRVGQIPQPALAESFVIQNGRQTRSRTLTFGIPIRPMEKGEFKIPPIEVQVDGKPVMTSELVLKVVEDMQGEELGVFEIDAPANVVEGQPFWIEMRFGFDRSLRESLNYYNLSLPWLGELAGLVELDAPPIPQSLSKGEILLNSNERLSVEAQPEKTVDGRSFFMLRVRKRFVATRAGKLELPTSHFEFGRVVEDFFQRGQRTLYYKRFPAFTIEAATLPEEGRPLDFSGAVGTFKVNATADRRDVDAGDSIKLTVDWSGEGNLDFFTPPDLSRLESFAPFRVYGVSDRKTYERRTVTYDIAPISPDTKEIPPVPLSVFDPEKKTYTTIQTAPIPIRVRALKGASGLGEETPQSGVVFDIRDIQTQASSAREGRAPGLGGLAGGVGAALAGWVVLRTLVRRRADPASPRERARRKARSMLARALRDAHGASAQARAVHAFLAARTGESAEAWAGRDVASWMHARREDELATLGEDDARELQRVLRELEARTWAGRDEALERSELLALADRVVRGGL